MYQIACDIIRSCLTQDIKYFVMKEISAKKIWEVLESKYLTKSIDNHLHLKRRLHHFHLKNIISTGEHINNYMKLLVDLVNVNKVIKVRTRL